MPRRRTRRTRRRQDPFVRDVRNITAGTSMGLIGLGVGMAGYKMIRKGVFN